LSQPGECDRRAVLQLKTEIFLLDTDWIIDDATGTSDDPPLSAKQMPSLASWFNNALSAGFRDPEALISEVFSRGLVAAVAL
jgi:hypothetical protein